MTIESTGTTNEAPPAHARVIGTLNEMVERRDRRLAELEAAIRRVETLANDLEGNYQRDPYGDFYAGKIRAALADPAPVEQ